VVLYDQRGHGSSTMGRDGCTIERLGGDLRAVLEHVDGRDAVLAGHSMGGMTVQALATWHPEVVEERAKAIVLVATAASGRGRGSGDAAAARAVGARVVDRALRSPIGHALVRGSVGQAVRRHDLVTTRDLFVACSGEVRSQWLEAMLSMDLRKGIAGIGVPTTVLVGTHDRLTPPARADELVATIPGARLQVLEGRGHMLPLEAPHDVAHAIAQATTG
jgi:pimeloyl-ACP methyl ester carboxylesterase